MQGHRSGNSCRYMCRPPGRARNCHAICRPFNELEAVCSVWELAKRSQAKDGKIILNLSFETSHTPASAGHPQTFALASARMKLLQISHGPCSQHTSGLHTTRKSGLGDRALPWHRQVRFQKQLRLHLLTSGTSEHMHHPSMCIFVTVYRSYNLPICLSMYQHLSVY